MAYYLGKEREADCKGAYRRYQEYLHLQRDLLPPSAFALGTSEWYQHPGDHRCPHDAWLEQVVVSEQGKGERNEKRVTSIRIRLFGAYHDGCIEFFYPQVFSYSLASPSSARGLGDWRYDEFRVSSAGHLLHEIEWAGFFPDEGSRWIIESTDVEFLWIPKA